MQIFRVSEVEGRGKSKKGEVIVVPGITGVFYFPGNGKQDKHSNICH
jgi:hypothetical protein